MQEREAVQMANNRNSIMFELAQVKTLDMEYAMQIIIMVVSYKTGFVSALGNKN